MNITLQVDADELHEYDDLADFSPVDSSSVWELCSAEDLGTVVRTDKEEFDVATGSYEVLPPWGVAQAQMSICPAISGPLMPGKSNKRSIRDILRGVMVSEGTLQCAVAKLGGGAQGLLVLMDHVNFWASSASNEQDVTDTIRKGIIDLGMPSHPIPGGFEAPWTNASRGSGKGINRGAAYTRALRKLHTTRQRGHFTRVQRGRHSMTSKCGPQSRQWRTSTNNQWFHDLDPELGDANGKGYDFLFQKELRASDVSSLGRIVLPKKDAERHLPFLSVREGVMVTLEDYHSSTFWTARYRFWPNNKSRMYLLENIGGFVTFHRLQEGDLLLCYRNGQGGYVIRGQKVPPSVKAPGRVLSSKGAQSRETTQTAEMKTPINIAMPPEFMEGDPSTTGTITGSSDLANSFDSLKCTLRGISDHGKAFDDEYISRQQSSVAQQMGYNENHEEDVLKIDRLSASYNPLGLQDSSYDPVVAMLAVNGEEFLEPDFQDLKHCFPLSATSDHTEDGTGFTMLNHLIGSDCKSNDH